MLVRRKTWWIIEHFRSMRPIMIPFEVLELSSYGLIIYGLIRDWRMAAIGAGAWLVCFMWFLYLRKRPHVWRKW